MSTTFLAQSIYSAHIKSGFSVNLFNLNQLSIQWTFKKYSPPGPDTVTLTSLVVLLFWTRIVPYCTESICQEKGLYLHLLNFFRKCYSVCVLQELVKPWALQTWGRAATRILHHIRAQLCKEQPQSSQLVRTQIWNYIHYMRSYREYN